MSFSWNADNSCFMLSFSPNRTRIFTEHALYKVTFDETVVKAQEIDRYRSSSKKQTRLVHCTLWNVEDSLFSAVFDETHSRLVIPNFLVILFYRVIVLLKCKNLFLQVVFNWGRERHVVENFVGDAIIAIKEMKGFDSKNTRLACLSEKELYFFDVCYS